MIFLTTLVFVILFYLIPLSHLIHNAIERWAGLPIWFRGFNLPYILVMSALYIGCYLLLKWLLLMTEVVDDRVIHRLNELISVKGLRRFNCFVLTFVVLLLVVGFLYNVYDFGLRDLLARLADYFMGEELLFLCAILYAGFAENLTVELPTPRPKLKVPYVPPQEPEGLEKQEAEEEIVVVPALFTKTYRWTYNDRPYMPGAQPREYAVELQLDKNRYDRLRAEKREVDVIEWDNYVKTTSREVLNLAAKLIEIREREEWSSFDEVANLIAFVQGLEYQPDLSPNGELIEWPKYPLETLWDGGGDCEDSAILAASLLLRLGYDVALLFLPSHTALGIAGAEGLPGTFLEVGGRRYYYYETTQEGWEFGELPARYRGANFRVLPIEAEEVAAVPS